MGYNTFSLSYRKVSGKCFIMIFLIIPNMTFLNNWKMQSSCHTFFIEQGEKRTIYISYV